MRVFTYQRAGAVVIDGDRVLLIGMQPPGGTRWYHFPGGGIEDGEDARTAAHRELLEETGLRAVDSTEYLRLGVHGGRHRYYLMTCDDLTIGEVTGPEVDYAAGHDFRAEWIAIDDLARLPVFPRMVAEHLAAGHRHAPPADAVPDFDDDRGSWDGLPDASPPTHVRFTSRAIVIDRDHFLAIERRLGDDRWFTTPGGGIEDGESPAAAAVREVCEETGLEVEAAGTLAVVMVRFEPGRESLQTYVRCVPTGRGVFGEGTGEEFTDERWAVRGTYRPVWLPLTDLPATLRPHWLAERLPQWAVSGRPARPDRFCEFHDE